MERAFLTRAPNASELKLLGKYLGSYRDGSGNNREKDGTSRADSRQIERCFAELLHGTTTESKFFYDFVVEFNESGGIAVRGASLKSKEIQHLTEYKNPVKRAAMRAHLELSNSNATDWALCAKKGLTQKDFESHKRAAEFGAVILERQKLERQRSESTYCEQSGGVTKTFIARECVYISILYSPPNHGERSWLVSSFSVDLPKPAQWSFRERCIVGTDNEGGTLYEWYALSGSQFKYYPKLKDRLYGTDLFQLPKPTTESLRAKATRLFGD